MKRTYITPAITNVALCNDNQLMSGSAGGRSISVTGLNGALNYNNAPLDLSGAR